MGRFWRSFGTALARAYEHGALGYAKGAAYSALLAFLPVITTTTAILVQMNAVSVSRKIVGFIFKVTPPGVEDLFRSAVTERGQRPLALPVLATILTVWAASGVMISLMEGFQSSYGKATKRGVFHNRGIAMWLVVAAVVPVVGASGLIVTGDRAETLFLKSIGVLPAGETLQGGVRVMGMLIRYFIALSTIIFVTGVVYIFGPDAGRRRRIWPGSLLATTLWLLVTQGFAWYVRNIANYNVLYGSIGAVLALMVWMYMLALISMVGCEFNIQLDRRKQ